jgi:hypothetical protein
MKFLQKIWLGLVAVLAVNTAQAQMVFDSFAAMRWMTIIPMTNIVTSTGGANGTTNFIDRIGFEGIASIIVPWQTNSGAATGTVYVQSSPDQTNWTALAYALATNVTKAIITNSAYATTNVFLTATNTEILPGPFTTPVAATAGYASPYVGSISFTNTNSITLSSVQPAGTTLIGFNVGDAYRYIRVGFAAGTTNSTVGAFLVGRKSVGQ